MGTWLRSTTGTKGVPGRAGPRRIRALFVKKVEKHRLVSDFFGTGASRRRAQKKGCTRRSGAPLLQFWHHEVTDCSAKTSVPKEEEPNQNLKGFQRDWWDPAPSVFYCFYNVFATLVQKCFHSAIEDYRDHISEFWVRVCSAGKCARTHPPKRGHILNLWSPSCSKMLSFGGGTPVAPTFSGNEVRTQVTAGTDFSLLAKKYENELIFIGRRSAPAWHSAAPVLAP